MKSKMVEIKIEEKDVIKLFLELLKIFDKIKPQVAKNYPLFYEKIYLRIVSEQKHYLAVFAIPPGESNEGLKYWIRKRREAKRYFLLAQKELLQGRKWRFVDEKKADGSIWTRLIVYERGEEDKQ